MLASLAISLSRERRSGDACLATCRYDRDALEKHHADALAAIPQRAANAEIRAGRNYGHGRHVGLG